MHARAFVALALLGLMAGAGASSTAPEARVLSTLDPAHGFGPRALQDAYGVAAVHEAGLDGDGVAVGLVTWGPPSQADLDVYSDTFGLPRARLEWRSGSLLGCTGEPHPEWDLDAQMAHAMAPEARILVYCAPAPRLADLLAAFRLAIRDGTVDVLSISWGTCEPSVAPDVAQGFAAAAADAARAGIAVFVASGDGGSRECTRRAAGDLALATSFPAVLPDVVAVGGTRLVLEPARAETVWNTCAPCPEMAWSASGGGVSARFAAPPWQPEGMRRVADVAAVADRATGVAVRTGGAWVRMGGTSVAAPLWAGAWAALVEEAGPRGNPAPLLWAHPEALRDVTDGHNGDHAAAAGHDLPSGWGSLDGEALLALLRDHPLPPDEPVTGSKPTRSATLLRSALLSQSGP